MKVFWVSLVLFLVLLAGIFWNAHYVRESTEHLTDLAEEEQTVEDPVTGYCGNMTAAIDVAGEHFEISGSDAVALTDILINLNYDPAQVCRCMTDITVDTETLTGIRINLGEAFARCEKGQAALTEDQVQVIRQIIEKLS